MVSEEEMPGFIPVPANPAAGLRSAGERGDGSAVWWFRCPDCGTWAEIDDDQLNGRAAIACTAARCAFREAWDLSALTSGGASA